jgi:type II secretion system (T2SS) protein E
MQMKVGSMLVKERIITEAQLEEALKNQVIFGGKIGTNLIELGYLTADRLSEFLSKNKGVPYATAEELQNIPPQVIATISAELVKKHQVIPIALDKKRLTVAMADPSDLATIDRLAFITGCYINPVVIPEILLITSMERYYKIKRATRYIAIAKDMRRDPRDADNNEINEKSAPVPAQEKKPEEPKEEEFIEIPEFNGFDKVEIPEAPEPEEVSPLEEPDEYNITDMCSELANATSREMIGEALMEYLRRRHFRAALFLPKEPTLTGWLAAEESGYVDKFGEVRIEMAAPSSFLQVIETKNFCMGQLHNPTDLIAASAMGANDHPAILLPIVLMNRVVAILCVVDSLEKLTRSLNELQKIAMKSAMAFEILIMRNKIQMV